MTRNIFREGNVKPLTNSRFEVKFWFLVRQIFSTYRMVIIRRALHSPDPRASVEHLKGDRMTYRNFLGASEVSSLPQNQSKYDVNFAFKRQNPTEVSFCRAEFFVCVV